MTKRASGKFKRRKQDFYPTPASAVIPLLPHLIEGTRFVEPCAGNGALTLALQDHGHICTEQSDINPKVQYIRTSDALDIHNCSGEMFITNPAWTREILHSLIWHLSGIAPTWLLFDADWMHTKQAIPYLERCERIVSVGRVSWMGNGVSGFDNCAWHLFDGNGRLGIAPRFYGRV